MATSTRKTAAKKTTLAAPAEPVEVSPAGDGPTGEPVDPKPEVTEPVTEPVAELAAPGGVAPAGDGPTGEPVDPKDDVVEDPAALVAPEAPRQTPATASLEAPENRIPPGDGVEPKGVIKDSSGQLSVDMLTQGPSEVRSELYDAATKKAPNPDEVFDLEFPNGQAVICQIRLCENLWITGQNEPMSRLVMAKGQRTDRAYAEQIVSILKRQLDGDAESPAGPLEV